MKNKLLASIGLLMLSFFIVSGCANDQDPPPEDTNDQPGVMDNNDISDPNDGTNNNGTGTNGTNGNGTGNNNGGDVNFENDGDAMIDNNDPGEDIIEDSLDMNDNDNKDR